MVVSKLSPELVPYLTKSPITPLVIKLTPYIGLYEGLKEIEGLGLTAERMIDLPNLRMVSVLGNLEVAKRLTRTSSVEKVMYDRPVSILWDFPLMNAMKSKKTGLFEMSSEYILDTETIRELIGINEIEEIGITGKGIKIGVIDTGFWANPRVYGMKRPQYAKVVDDTRDGNGHGSHVSSIIWSPKYEFPNDITVHGLSPDAELMAVKSLRTPMGVGASSEIAEAIQNCYQNNVNLINMSLGGEIDPSTFDWRNDPICLSLEAIFEEAGIISVVAVGNSGKEPGSPAVSPHAIAIGSYSHHYENVAYFSSRGNTPDGRTLPHALGYGGGANSIEDEQELIAGLTMPGALLDVIGGGLPEGLSTIMGTSQGSPTVCGTIALYNQFNLEKHDRLLTYDELISILRPNEPIHWEHGRQYIERPETMPT